MLNIPAALFTKYSILLNKKSVPVSVSNKTTERLGMNL